MTSKLTYKMVEIYTQDVVKTAHLKLDIKLIILKVTSQTV